MGVGLSARVIRLQTDGTAIVDASGARREISAQLLDDLMPGDYVMVHAGAAIARSPRRMTRRAMRSSVLCFDETGKKFFVPV